MLEIGWRAGLSWVSSSYPVFYRNYRNGVFDTDRGNGRSSSTTSSRAVVVVGAGLLYTSNESFDIQKIKFKDFICVICTKEV